MNKLFLIFALLMAVVFTQFVGGYKAVPESALQDLINSDMFKQAEAEARKEFSLKENAELGHIIGVKEQIVAGINYKITFASPIGN